MDYFKKVLPKAMHIQDDRIAKTYAWIEHMVIGRNLCPFAKSVWLKNNLHCTVVDTSNPEELVLAILEECKRLDENPSIETILVVAPEYHDFLNFLDMVDIATECMHRKSYEGIYQLASFHPNYQFEGTKSEDLENYTNRSPFPTFHILRENSLEKAIRVYGDTDAIPKRNIAALQSLGESGIASIYATILNSRSGS